MKKINKGFTLVELMVVVAIIGIIASIVIPKFADMIRKAKEATTKGNLGTLRSGVKIYYAGNEGIYPRPLDQWSGTVYGHVNFAAVLVPKYISKIPGGWHFCNNVYSGGTVSYPKGRGNWDENWYVRSYQLALSTGGWGCFVGYYDTGVTPPSGIGWSYCPDNGQVYIHCDPGGAEPGNKSTDLKKVYYYKW